MAQPTQGAAIQHDHAVRDLLPHIEDLSARLSVSERIAPVAADFAESLAADVRAGLGCGAADYFVKPLDLDALLARINELTHPPSASQPAP